MVPVSDAAGGEIQKEWTGKAGGTFRCSILCVTYVVNTFCLAKQFEKEQATVTFDTEQKRHCQPPPRKPNDDKTTHHKTPTKLEKTKQKEVTFNNPNIVWQQSITVKKLPLIQCLHVQYGSSYVKVDLDVYSGWMTEIEWQISAKQQFVPWILTVSLAELQDVRTCWAAEIASDRMILWDLEASKTYRSFRSTDLRSALEKKAAVAL